MWSAAIWLLSLTGATTAQYGFQQTIVKPATTQVGIDYSPAVGYSLHFPQSKIKYYPPPDLPRPDFKYIKSQKQVVGASVGHEFRGSALEAFMKANGRVKFTIRNLGPNPSYGPFSGFQFGGYSENFSEGDLSSERSGPYEPVPEEESGKGGVPQSGAGVPSYPYSAEKPAMVIDKASAQVPSGISTTDEIIPPTGPGTHLGPIMRPGIHPMPPSSRPPSKQKMVSGSRKSILSSLSSPEVDAFSNTESTTTVSVQWGTPEVISMRKGTAAPKLVSGSRNDILSGLGAISNLTSSHSQTSSSILTASKQTYDSTTEILEQTNAEHNGAAPPGFGPPKAVPPAAVSMPSQNVSPAASFDLHATATPPAASMANISAARATATPAAVPPAPSVSTSPDVPTPQPSFTNSISPASVPAPQPETVPVPLPDSSLPELPYGDRTPSQHIPSTLAPPALMPSISPPHTPLPQPPPSPSVPSQPIDGTPPPAPLSQTSPQSNLLPQPSGSSPYEPSSGYVPVPAPETVAPLTAPTQTSTDLQTRANGISSPGAAGELPAGPSVYEGPVIYPSVPSLPVSSVVPAVPKYEIENQIASSRIEEPLPSPYGNEVEASVQVDEDRQLSRSEGPLPLQPIGSDERNGDNEEYYDSETEAPPGQEPISNLKATVRTGSRVTEQKVGSRVETAKSGSGVYQTEEHVPAAIPQSPTPSVASNSLPPPTSSYGGSFGSGGLSAGFDGNVGNAQVDINSGGHGANYVGGSGGLVGLTGINSYSGPGSVGFGGPSGVPSISQGSYTTGEQSLRVGGQSLGGQLLGGQQNAYLVAPLRGTGGDGCCGGSWLSRSGGFCSPINFNPCLPALLPIPSCKCCCCCCPGSRCAPSQQQCQSSCMSSCCLPSLPGLCGRRKKRTTSLRYLGLCR